MTSASHVGWVLVVDDDAGLARSVALMLRQWVPCEVAGTPDEALALHASRPHLVGALIDLYLGDDDGVSRVAEPLRARDPGVDIRIFTAVGSEDSAIPRVRAAGFWLVSKEGASEQLRALGPLWGRLAERASSPSPRSGVQGVSGADVGDPVVDRRLSEVRLAGTLTPRQLEILHLQVRGLSHTEIAKALGLSVKSIEHHSTEAQRRTGKSLFEHAHDVVEGTSHTLRRLPRS